MDIKAIITQLVEKVKADPNILAQIKADPVNAIKDLIGQVVPADSIKEILSGLESQLGGDALKGVTDKLGGGDLLKGVEEKVEAFAGDAEKKAEALKGEAEKKAESLKGEAEEAVKKGEGGLGGILDAIKKIF